MPDISYTNQPELATPVVVKTSSSTILPEEMNVLCDASSGNQTQTLPAEPLPNGRSYTFTKTDTTANTVRILSSGGTINDQSNWMLRTQYKFVRITPNPNDSTKWTVTGNN